jgi:hypothetical protein
MWRFIICPAFLLAAVGCDGHTSLKGEVVGPDDQPIAGALVRLIEPQDAERERGSETDAAGRYSVALTHAPFDIPLVVTVKKDGYKPYRKEFRVRERESFPKKIVLEPDPQAPPEKN